MKHRHSPAARLALASAPLMLLVAGMAVGHPGHDHAHSSGFAAGLAHPLLGLDHLLAMLAVGLWSLRQSRAFSLAAPLLAAGGMLLGAGLAWVGLALPGVEFGIAMSVLLAGVLIAALVKVPAAVGAGVVVLFMLFHGHAHGSEIPHGASMLTYLAGFTLATLAVTYAGRLAGGLLMQRENRFLRALGVAITAAGALLAFG
ncbi:HupE/UreJ family protein [Halomonas sp. MCCC 1A17488]|uniref:HupE/UreJ family protein n=1 Tax=unclassified Halomonas TaxID=2609666 RepID=UPI0018D21B96|nr:MULTISPECIES: HupE/UreJ family protein [unclassified Halomonas]MCE8015392.1 HupE/UreJ family protein [Halomonas sp. MCCC 1A17488]MCG3238725.1 HupE/UreJ family protein [Halomonas sp. MCCC 1A17488]QPP51306.1 HupE/UreJ family protein [Halomonas sp. SS10-MC5]